MQAEIDDYTMRVQSMADLMLSNYEELERSYAEKIQPLCASAPVLVDVRRNTPIADEFTDIWASEFHYDEQGCAVVPCKIISFTDKTRYIFQIQKGIIGKESRGKPFAVNRRVPTDQIRIPVNQMVFVGDGYTDIPCFSLIKQNGGIPIAVYDHKQTEKWGNAFQFVADGRVSTLHSADYRQGSDLVNFLTMAVRSLAERIAVSASSYQG